MPDQKDDLNKPMQSPGQNQPMTPPKPDQGAGKDVGQGRKAGDEDLQKKQAPAGQPDRSNTEADR